jgi:hypothetical protein
LSLVEAVGEVIVQVVVVLEDIELQQDLVFREEHLIPSQ